MTSKRNKIYCEMCHRSVNKARIAKCRQEDCVQQENTTKVIKVDFQKTNKTVTETNKPTILTVEDDMIDLKLDPPESGMVGVK